MEWGMSRPFLRGVEDLEVQEDTQNKALNTNIEIRNNACAGL